MHRIAAPCVFDGDINGERFRAYVEQMLAPTLRLGDFALPDMRSSHKARNGRGDRGAPRPAGPAVQPYLYPIEQAFAKFKAVLRHAAERTREGPVADHRSISTDDR